MTRAPVCSDTLARARALLIRMHHQSGVGHLGGNLSVIDALALLTLEVARPTDHVILSKGHSAGALYVCLAMAGHIPENELATFHKNGTRLPGHPPVNLFDSIPFATGSLGHGLSLAAGLALASKLQGGNDRVYCVMSDGEWQEGSTWEALWFAKARNLDNLTLLVDQNGLQGFGAVEDIAAMGDLATRVAAHGLPCETVDGHDLAALRHAFAVPHQGQPKAIFAQTVKGKGVAQWEGEMQSHYVPLTDAAAQDALDRIHLEPAT